MNAVAALLAFGCLGLPDAPPAVDVKPNVTRGLDWLARQQQDNGSWIGVGGQYPAAITGLAGLALLMEGSTVHEGKYAPHLRKAVQWYERKVQPGGLLGSDDPGEQARYMYGHGYGMLFLACAYGDEENADRRKRLEKLLAGAVTFAAKAQTQRGGWGYVAAAEGNEFDEAFTTVVLVQGLRAARNAGIAVPRATIDRAMTYLERSTDQAGGVLYAANQPGPVLTAAVAALVPHGAKDPKFVKWINVAAARQTPDLTRRGNDLLQHFYFAQAAYFLDEDGHARLDPTRKAADLVRWSAYRKVLYTSLQALQKHDGSWTSGNVGPVFETSLALIVLQLENETVPFFSRLPWQR
jgi:hypothetical protein